MKFQMAQRTAAKAVRVLQGSAANPRSVASPTVLVTASKLGILSFSREEQGGFLTVLGTALPAGAIEAGGAAVEAGALLADLKERKGDIEVSLTGGMLSLHNLGAPPAVTLLRAADASSFPPEPLVHKTSAVNAADLSALFTRVIHAMGAGKSRPWLNGVTFRRDGGDVTAFATDGHRLARFRAPMPSALGLTTQSAFLSAEHARHVAAVLDALAPMAWVNARFETLEAGVPTLLRLDLGDARMTFPVKAAEGVAWDQAIPRGADYTVILNKKLALAGFNKLSAAAGKLRTLGANILLAGSQLTAEIHDAKGARAIVQMPVILNPQPEKSIIRGCNPASLAEALAVCTGEDVQLWINTDPMEPLMVKDSGAAEFVGLMMPTRPALSQPE